MRVLEDKKNDLLKRREVKLVVEASSNPSVDRAKSIVAEKLEAEEEGISVKKIMGKFGRNTFLIVANIYKNREDKEKTEPKTKKQAEQKAEHLAHQKSGRPESTGTSGQPKENIEENKDSKEQ